MIESAFRSFAQSRLRDLYRLLFVLRFLLVVLSASPTYKTHHSDHNSAISTSNNAIISAGAGLLRRRYSLN